MAISYNQSTSSTNNSATSIALAYPSNVTSGNLLVAMFAFGTSVTFNTISDSLGNTWNQYGTTYNAQGGLFHLHYVRTASTGANTVTMSISSAAAALDLMIVEYNGFTSLATDGGPSQANGSTGNIAGAPFTASSATELLIDFYGGNANVGGFASGWTNRITDTFVNGFADNILSASGTYTFSATQTSGAWVSQTFGFRLAGGVIPAVASNPKILSP